MATPRFPPLPSIREILQIYKLQAFKQLSQNFILDQNLCNKIINKAKIVQDSHVLEVGPGPGSLTRSIMKKLPQKLIVVEKDERFKPTLDMLIECFNEINRDMEVIYDDIKNINMSKMFPESMKKDWDDKKPDILLIGNLPFSVSTYLIIQWLREISERTSAWSYGRAKMTLTFQKEVAERIVAEPMTKQRCRLSVMAQAWTYPVYHFVIPGRAFVPSPDVDVGVVSLVPLVKPRTNHEFKLFEKVVREVFHFRRKYCIRGIETLFPLEFRKDLSEMMCKLADVDPQAQPTQLTVEDYDRLCTAYKYLSEKHPEIGLYQYRSSRNVLYPKCTGRVRVEDCDYDNDMDEAMHST